jgi:hypothetical protein
MQLNELRRRAFITLLGGTAASFSLLWPPAARAQQPRKLPTIGFVGPAQRLPQIGTEAALSE